MGAHFFCSRYVGKDISLEQQNSRSTRPHRIVNAVFLFFVYRTGRAYNYIRSHIYICSHTSSPVYGAQISAWCAGVAHSSAHHDMVVFISNMTCRPSPSYCGWGRQRNTMDSFPTVKEVALGLCGAVGLYVFMWSLFALAVYTEGIF